MELIKTDNEVTGIANEVIAEITRNNWVAGEFLQDVLQVMLASGTKTLTLDGTNVEHQLEHTPVKLVFLGDKVIVEVLN